MKFQDKVVVVTGAGKGIGRAVALAFAAEGAFVVCNSISNSAEEVADRFEDRRRALFVRGDVSKPSSAEEVIQKTVLHYGKIDILFNNAGIVIPGTLESTTLSDWDTSIAVNLRSVFLMSSYAFPHLASQRGAIVNNASAVALFGVANRVAYSASKGAIVAMTRSMAVDSLRYGVRVNCICPGTVDTPSLHERISLEGDEKRAMTALVGRQPIGRLGTPEEIADGVLYLAGAAFCTGTCLSVDGGMTELGARTDGSESRTDSQSRTGGLESVS